MPVGAVYVGRPTKLGNPFVVGSTVGISGVDADRLLYQANLTMTAAMAVAAYRDLMSDRLTITERDDAEARAYVESWRAIVAQLRGRPLACWCPLDQPCHADVLLELANNAT
jgi:hypothetical protein